MTSACVELTELTVSVLLIDSAVNVDQCYIDNGHTDSASTVVSAGTIFQLIGLNY